MKNGPKVLKKICFNNMASFYTDTGSDITPDPAGVKKGIKKSALS